MTLRRFAAMGGALVVAALASYSHMRAVAFGARPAELIADLLPISVDGMTATATTARALATGQRPAHRVLPAADVGGETGRVPTSSAAPRQRA